MTDRPSGAGAMPDALSQLWSRFRGTILERVRVLEDSAVAVLSGALDAEQRRRAQREAHKLAGSVGTFGFAEASRLARSVELLMEGTDPLTEADALRLSEWVLALRTQLERPRAAVEETASTVVPGDDDTLLLITADDELAERVEMEAVGRGLDVARAATAAVAERLLDQWAPGAVLLDLAVAANARDPLSLLDAVALRSGGAPVVVLGERDGLAERVAVVRRGGRTFVSRPASPVQLLDAVEHAMLRRSAAGARVLVLDDDPEMLRLLETLLGGRGMDVRPVDEAARFWTELRREPPDLVVLDLDMPGLDGIELCRTLRSDPLGSSVPVLFLTARTDPSIVRALFDAGADDYVAKPVVGPELVMRIENRLERVRLQGAAGAATAPGGLPGRERTGEELSRLLQLARRVGTQVAVARIDIDGMEALNSRLGTAAGDEILKRVALLLQARVPPGDVVGWWGGDGFAIGMFGADGGVAMQWLGDILQAMGRDAIPTDPAEIRVTFSAGVGCFPADGLDLVEVCTAAERALSRAREAGGGQVIPYRSDGGAQPVDVVDVVVVEDDAVVAELLLHAMAVQGYSTRHLTDGDQAVSLLAGSAPTLLARVIVLDVDLPGRDGLGVLRELARREVLERSHVVMLTARSTEREVLRALELGARDHVAKPFSVPVLMRRVRALLQKA